MTTLQLFLLLVAALFLWPILSGFLWSCMRWCRLSVVVAACASLAALAPSVGWAAQTGGSVSTGGDPALGIFGYQVTPSQIAYAGLASLVCTIGTSIASKPSTKGWQKTAINIVLALITAGGSYFIHEFGENGYVITALSIFTMASIIYATNAGGFRSLTADVGRK